MREAVIVSGARTAVGRSGRGTLRFTRPEDLAAATVKEAIHRAKGLEAGTIWWLPSKNRQSSQKWQQEQEKNLCYVATTRAMERLFFVTGE